MPQRPPSFAERLRSALGHASGTTTTPARPASAGESSYKGSEFAERLRRAVTSR
jgi:hypothetical protein